LPLPNLPPIDSAEWTAYSVQRLRQRARRDLVALAQQAPPRPYRPPPELAAPAAPVPPGAPGVPEAPPTAPAVAPAGPRPLPEDLVPNQLKSGELTTAEAMAACGPAAAVAFARAQGRNPTLREAVDLAKRFGWTERQGMAGPLSQKKLLDEMGVPSRVEQGADWAKVRADVEGGNPVAISTPKHYFVATGYDPETDKFNFQESGAVLKGGGRWLSPAQVGQLGNRIQATIYTDNPTPGTKPSVATSIDPGFAAPAGFLGAKPNIDPGFYKHAETDEGLAAQKYGLDPDIFFRQISQESGGRANAVSPAGARGVGQFMPATAAGVAQRMGGGVTAEQIMSDKAVGLDAAAYHMREMLDQYGGDYAKALAAYNAGPGAVAKYGGVPPFKETQTYISRILGEERPIAGPAAPAAPAPAEVAAPTPSGPSETPPWMAQAYARLDELEQRYSGVLPPPRAALPPAAPVPTRPTPDFRALANAQVEQGLAARAAQQAARAAAVAPPPPVAPPEPLPPPEPMVEGIPLSRLEAYDQPTTVTGPPPGFMPPAPAEPLPVPFPETTISAAPAPRYTGPAADVPVLGGIAAGIGGAASAVGRGVRTVAPDVEQRLIDAGIDPYAPENREAVELAQRQANLGTATILGPLSVAGGPTAAAIGAASELGALAVPGVVRGFGGTEEQAQLGGGIAGVAPAAPGLVGAGLAAARALPTVAQAAGRVAAGAAEEMAPLIRGPVTAAQELGARLRPAAAEVAQAAPAPAPIVQPNFAQVARQAPVPMAPPPVSPILQAPPVAPVPEGALVGPTGRPIASAVEAVAPTGTTTARGISDPSQVYEFRYRVVPLDELVTSHTPRFTENPAYPQELQPRIRDRAASRLQVDQIAQRLEPDALLEDVGQLDRGPMIVGPDLIVESGNGRTMALRMARDERPQRFGAYEARLRELAPRYGIDPAEVAGMRDPVLVRERITPVDRARFAQEGNASAVLTMSPVETAARDAGRLPDQALANLAVGEAQSIDQALVSAANRPFVRAWMGTIPDNERAALITATQELNLQGRERLKQALFTKTYGGDAGGRLAATFFESIDPLIRNVEQGMFASLPAIARSEGLIRAGTRPAGLSIADDIAKAVNVLARLKQNGIPVADYVGQQAMFGRELDPTQTRILEHVNEIARSPRAVRQFFETYATAVDQAADVRQGGMFGAAPPTKEALLDQAVTASRPVEPAGGLFAEPLPAAPAAPPPSARLAQSAVPAPTPAAGLFPESAPAATADLFAAAPPAPAATSAGLEKPTAALTRPAQLFAPDVTAAGLGGVAGAQAAQPAEGEEPDPQRAAMASLLGLSVGLFGRRGIAGAARAARESRVGFAGNIRLGKYPEEVRAVIQRTFEENPAALETVRRGVISDDEVRELARGAGVEAERVLKFWKPGDVANAETLLSLREALGAQATRVLAAQRAARDAPWELRDSAVLELTAELTTHRALQEAVAGLTAEAGRALRQFRQPITGDAADAARLKEFLAALAPGKKDGLPTRGAMTTDEMVQLLLGTDLNNPEQVAAAARELYRPTGWDRARYIWINSLLSGPPGRIRDVASTSFSTATAPLETGAAALVDVPLTAGRRAVQRLRGQVPTAERQVFFGEVPAEYRGMGDAMPQAMKDGWSTLTKGYTAAGESVRSDIGTIAHREAFHIPFAPTRFVGATDAVYGALNRRGALGAIAYREAAKEAAAQGLNAAEEVARRDYHLAHPTAAMLEESDQTARYRTFLEGGALAKSFSKLKNEHPWISAFVPFHNTATALMKYALERSPIGFGILGVQGARGKLSQRQVSEGIARATLGTAFWTTAYKLAEQQDITGAAPRDPKERDAFYRSGRQEYSIRLGDKWWNYQNANFAPVLASAVAARSAMERGESADALALGVTATMGIARAMVDLPFMQGVQDLNEVIDDPERMGPRYAEQWGRAVVPQAIQFLARASDDIIRDPDNPVEAAMTGIPGLSQRVRPKIDAFGNVVERPEGTQGAGALNPLRASTVRDNPVERELTKLRLTDYASDPGFVTRKQTFAKQEIELSADERNQLQQTRGKLAYAVLAQIINDPSWASIPDAEKARIIHGVYGKAHEQAKASMTEPLIPRIVAAANRPAIGQVA
jgi:hypothetical protein